MNNGATARELLCRYASVRARLMGPHQTRPRNPAPATPELLSKAGLEVLPPPPSPPPPPPPPPPSLPHTSARDDFLTIEKIIRTTCLEFGCSRAQLLSRSRRTPAVLRRFIAISLSFRFVARQSTNQIGRQFQRDHSTVMHARSQMQPVIDAILVDMPEASIAELVSEMRRRLEDDGWLGKQIWEAGHDL